MDNIKAWYDVVSQIGFPLLFIWGLIQGWWVMRSEHALIKEWVQTLNQHVLELLKQLTRAADVAERATLAGERSSDEIRDSRILLTELAERLDDLMQRFPDESGG